MNLPAMAVRANLQLRSKPRRGLHLLARPLFLRLQLAARKKRKTSSSMADLNHQYTAAVVTVSDSCSRGMRDDRSGPAVAQLLEQLKFSVVVREVIPDDRIQIQNLLIRLVREVQLVVTTGGTGVALTDVTPEATVAVCDRLLDGVAEKMRSDGLKKTPFAALSRGVCGARGQA